MGTVVAEPSVGVNVGDTITLVSTIVVAISLFMNWYAITISAAGMRFGEQLIEGMASRMFGHSLPALNGIPNAPYTQSISALDHNAGGWRWAILVVACVAAVELLLTIASTLSSQRGPAWPHGPLIVILTVTNLVLLGVAFFTSPLNGVPSTYLTSGHAVGAYVGVIAGIAAAAGAIVCVATSPLRRA